MRVGKKSRWNRGQAQVEFLIALPIAIFLTIATVDMGRHFYTRITVRHAVQEAGRFAVTGQTLTDPDTGNPMTRAESIKQTLLAKATALNIQVDHVT